MQPCRMPTRNCGATLTCTERQSSNRNLWRQVALLTEALQEPEGGFGIIDRRGKFIVEPIYRTISYFKEGFACAEDMETGEYWFLNEEGEKVFGPYKGAYLFHDGKALVKETEENRDWFYIDKKGKKYPFNEEVQIVIAGRKMNILIFRRVIRNISTTVV